MRMIAMKKRRNTVLLSPYWTPSSLSGLYVAMSGYIEIMSQITILQVMEHTATKLCTYLHFG